MSTANHAELEAALAWYQAHSKLLYQHRDQWVAIGPAGVLAHNKDVKKVLARSRKLGFPQPLLFKVPPAGMLALWNVAFQHRQGNLYFNLA
jgi:hypothetical protein